MNKPRILYTMFYDMLEQGQDIFNAAGGLALASGGGPLWVWMPRRSTESEIRHFFSLFLRQNPGQLFGIVANDTIARVCARVYAAKYGCSLNVGGINAYYLPNWAYSATRFVRLQTPGHARPADVCDWQIISNWVGAFYTETLNASPIQFTNSKKVDIHASANLRLHVWCVSDIPVAMGAYIGTGTTARLNLVYVPPEHRQRGYGRAIASYITQKIHEGGRTPVLYANTKNVTATKLYRSLGFLEAGRLTQIRFLQTVGL